MTRHILVLAALLILSNLALADYLLIKLDYEQIPFAALKSPDLLAKDPKGKPDSKVQSTNWIYGVFEVKKEDVKYFKPGADDPKVKDPKGVKPKDKGPPEMWRIEIDQKAGKKIFPILPGLFTIGDNIKDMRKNSAAEDFLAKKKDAKDASSLIDLAYRALQHGLTKEFQETMDELNRVAKNHPVYLRYDKTREDMKKKPAEPQMSDALKTELRSHKSKESDHYVIYWKEEGDADKEKLQQIQRRLTRFENAYQNFFYWCALQDSMPLPSVPKYRLAVQLETLPEFTRRLKDLGQVKSQASGVTLRRENLVVLSSSPNSDIYQKLKTNLGRARQEVQVPGKDGLVTAEELVTGSVWKRDTFADPKTKKFTPRLNVAVMQTLALLQGAMEEDIELSTISREGTRQLLGATGFLAHNVNGPEWLQAGLVSFFEIPPAHLHLGFGQPRGEYLRKLQAFKDDKSFKSADLLSDLATDQIFRAARNGSETKTDPAMGQAAAWGLVFYLAAERKTKYLFDYAQLLNSLPRHMVFQPETLEDCFQRGFRLGDVRDKGRLDADAWLRDMSNRETSFGLSDEFMVEAFFAPPRK